MKMTLVLVALFVFSATPTVCKGQIVLREARKELGDAVDESGIFDELIELKERVLAECDSVGGSRASRTRSVVTDLATIGPFRTTESDLKNTTPTLKEYYLLCLDLDTAYFCDGAPEEAEERVKAIKTNPSWASAIACYEVTGGTMSAWSFYTLFSSSERYRIVRYASDIQVGSGASSSRAIKAVEKYPCLKKRYDEAADGKFVECRGHSIVLAYCRRTQAAANAKASAAKEKTDFEKKIERDARTWTSKDGKFSTHAMYVSHSMDDKTVTLARSFDDRVTVPMDVLCSLDRAYLVKIIRARNKRKK